MPKCWIIAGPNGSGKTTFALEYLIKQNPTCAHFINADLIAAGLSPLNPEQKLLAASKLFLSEINTCIENKNNFAVETTLSGKTYLRLIKRLNTLGWETLLIYLALPSVKMSKLRVAERVKHGGHNIPTQDIERRYPRSLKNLLHNASNIVSSCVCYMNEKSKPTLIFSQQQSERTIHHQDFYQILLKGADK